MYPTPVLPNGDVLIHAGDLTQSGSLRVIQETLAWLHAQPHTVKITIAGNHDPLLDPSLDDRRGSGDAASERKAIDWGDIIYQENSRATVTCPNGRQLRLYGSPSSIRHGNWAFQYPRSEDVWAGTVPRNFDILVLMVPCGHISTYCAWGACTFCGRFGGSDRNPTSLDMFTRGPAPSATVRRAAGRV
jgi:hypothetical protein